MDREIKLKCLNCKKELFILLRFGTKEKDGESYAEVRRQCPLCGFWFGVISYSIIYIKGSSK